MNRVKTPQAKCIVGMSRCDITPPVGIYHRMWGAAMHDQATGVHRPLTATSLYLGRSDGDKQESQFIVSMDHCILDGAELLSIQRAIEEKAGIPAKNIQITLTHTHGSGWMSRTRSEFPGGEKIGPYLDSLVLSLAELACETIRNAQSGAIVFVQGRCNLAAHRDFFDDEKQRSVCGFNPGFWSDDTVLIAKVVDDSGNLLGSVVNYACHPTTLAWDNTLISPDWVGAMRELVERDAGGLCLFLQGASGDLGPVEGFVGDLEVAEKNGRQLGYAVLSALETAPKVGTEYRYAGPVISGTWIGSWKHVRMDDGEVASLATWNWRTITVELPYRFDLPTIEETIAARERWWAEERLARESQDEKRVRDCRANAEQMTRQLTRLQALHPGKSCPIPITIGELGDAIWVFTPGELYQVFQVELRKRLAPRPVMVTTLTGDWQPGYVPPATSFGYGIYQEVIAATAAGSLELLIETVYRELTGANRSELFRDPAADHSTALTGNPRCR